MKLLQKIIRSNGLNLDGKTVYREAVRGVIIKDQTLLMVYSSKNGDYKFLGGGVESGETHKIALTREIKEECGATLLSINNEFGKVIELDSPFEEDYDVFKMVSFYYICEIDHKFGEQSLDEYEENLGFMPSWVDIDQAILSNQILVDSKSFPRWTPRETFVLKHIKETFKL